MLTKNFQIYGELSLLKSSRLNLFLKYTRQSKELKQRNKDIAIVFHLHWYESENVSLKLAYNMSENFYSLNYIL